MIVFKHAFTSNAQTSFAQRTLTTARMQLRNVRVNRVAMPANAEIVLTDVEDQICTLLDECTQKLKTEKNITTSCRIAGGWVRDKVN
jgi:hypothetical protein